MFSEEGLKALQNAQKNIENRRNSRKPLVVKPYGNYRDPEGKNGKWYYHDFVSKYDNEYTKKLKNKMKKFHEYRENDPIVNRYKLYQPNVISNKDGIKIDSPLIQENKIFEQQKRLMEPQYQINKEDHGKDYLNFGGEQVHFDIHGNPISQEELDKARNALSSLKKKYAKKTTKPMVKYNNYINDDLSTNYSNDSLFDDYDWKDMSNEIPKDNEYSIDKDDIDLGF